MDPTLTLGGLGLLALLIVGYLIMDTGTKTPTKRIKTIGGNPNADRKSLMGFMKVDEGSNRRKQIEASLADLEAEQKDNKKKYKSLSSKLVQANWKMSVPVFMMISVVIGLIVFIATLVFKVNPLICIGAGFVTGFGLPRWFLNMVIKRRQSKFTSHFADAMDVIVRGVRTGLPLGDCLRIIAHEAAEPVRTEFAKLVEAEAVGVPIELCIERMHDRMPLPEVNFFGIVLNIQRSSGGNLGESLENLSNVLRDRKLLREKIKALSAEAKVSAIIIGALPIFVMTLVTMLSPEYMHELYFTPTGNRMLMIAAGMMVSGIVVMKKMINFKF